MDASEDDDGGCIRGRTAVDHVEHRNRIGIMQRIAVPMIGSILDAADF